MASKRKSTVPCMIPLKNTHFQGDFEQDTQSTKDTDFPVREKGVKSSQSLDETFRQEQLANLKDCGFYTCRLCHFETEDLNLFLDHVYSGHPDIHTDPCFVCLDCGTSAAKFEGLALHNARVHPSTITTTLQLNKRDSRYIVEQSLCIKSCERSSSKDIEISITKTPIMRMLKCKSEPKRIVVSHHSTDNIPLSTTEVVEKNVPSSVMTTHVPAIVHNEAKAALPSAIQIVNGSGALPLLKTAVTQVVPVVQGKSLNQQSAPGTISSSHSSSSSAKILPKVMIPLSSIPTYNTSMDSSSFLKTSFSKFPYPTKAELCYLTVVTKYPEEQIKIWFTAQRLKQGISWSPEEIEDARKKMFNTIIQTTHSNGQQQSQTNHTGAQPTITVLGTTGIPQILQGSLVGQGGVIVTQPMMANGVQVSSAPVTLAVTPKPHAATKPFMQARPAAALIADKGISMVLGTIGSSSSGRSTSNSSVRTSRFSSSNSSSSSLCSQTSIVSIAESSTVKCSAHKIGESSTAKSNHDGNDQVNTTDSNKASFQSDGLNVKENSKAKADANNKKNTSSTPTTTDNIAPKTSESPSPVSVNSHAISNNNMDAKTKKSQEQLAALKESFLASQFPDQEEVDRLISLTCLSVREVRKWFSDRRYHLKNLKGSKLTGQPVSTSPDNSQQDSFHQTETSTPPERPKTPQQSPLTPSQSSQVTPTKRPHRNQSPDFTAIRYKEREPGQVRALEASFATGPDPSSGEVDRLRGETKMTRREIHNWFAERRKKVAAKRKKEEAEMDEEALGLEEDFGVKKEERQNENTSKVEGNIEDRDDTEPKVNPIKINLKMLKVTGHGKGEPEVGHHTDNNKVSNVPHTTQYRGKKTHEQLHLLKQVFARTRWPSSLQYNELMAKTGLPRTDVVRWFGDSRYVLKNGQLKWLESYQVLVDNEDFQKADTSILKEHLEAHGSLDETKLDEVAKSTGFGEESIRRWFAQNAPVLLKEKTFEVARGEPAEGHAVPAEANSASLHPDLDEVVVEQSETNLISQNQNTNENTADTSSNYEESV